ncbi:MAG: type II toxin-antitoxin system RatA family toxin [Burkholderiales bacterium]|nr:type II toxin-antitoxin system RatA family toxin [Burkholderiales bacterium]
MLNISKSVITPFTPAQMYALVSDIENYKNYLPWCPSSQVLKRDGNKITGRVDISYLKVKAHFTTENINCENQRIDLSLVDGPFKHLKGHWLFTPLGTTGCKIEFKLDYAFSNFIIQKVIGTVFEMVIKNIVDSFVKKAHEIYRKA